MPGEEKPWRADYFTRCSFSPTQVELEVDAEQPTYSRKTKATCHRFQGRQLTTKSLKTTSDAIKCAFKGTLACVQRISTMLLRRPLSSSLNTFISSL